MPATTLQTVQPKKETKPQDVLGGALGWLNEIGELAVRGQGSLVNERPEVSPSYEAYEPKTTPVPEYIRKDFPSRGTIENFRQPDPKKVEAIKMQEITRVIEEGRAQNHQHKQELTIEDIARYGLAGTSKQQLAEEGNYQPNYEGESVDSIYNIVFVFLKRIVNTAKERIKSSFNAFETVKGKLSRMDYFMQHKMVGERAGGQHVLNAAG